MEDTLDYDKIAADVDAIDNAATQERVTIDISATLANRIEIKNVGYDEMDRMLESMETRKAEVASAQETAQPQTVTQQPAAQPLAPAPASQTPRVPQIQVGKEMESAGKRLRDMMGNAGKEFEQSVSQHVEEEKEKNLAMPKLSLHDQVDDLEKIEEGLNENVFDPEQLRVIGEEVGALDKIAARQDTSKAPDDQRELLVVREQKVKEIKARLNIG